MPLRAPVVTTAEFFAGRPPVVRSEGLVLRPWRASDAPAVARAYRDPAIAHWMLGPLEAAEAPAWVQRRARRWSNRSGVDFAVVADAESDPDGLVLLGRIGLHRLALEHGSGGVAYWVVPEQRGRWIAPRALRALSAWAFEVKGLHRLELGHSVANPASCRVAERAGFALEGTRRGQLLHADGWHDAHLHARLADDPLPAPPSSRPRPVARPAQG